MNLNPDISVLFSVQPKNINDENLRKNLVYQGFQKIQNSCLSDQEFLDWIQYLRKGDDIPVDYLRIFNASISLTNFDENSIKNIVPQVCHIVKDTKTSEPEIQNTDNIPDFDENTDLQNQLQNNSDNIYYDPSYGSIVFKSYENLTDHIQLLNYLASQHEIDLVIVNGYDKSNLLEKCQETMNPYCVTIPIYLGQKQFPPQQETITQVLGVKKQLYVTPELKIINIPCVYLRTNKAFFKVFPSCKKLL